MKKQRHNVRVTLLLSPPSSLWFCGGDDEIFVSWRGGGGRDTMCRSLRVDGNIGWSKLSLIIIAKKTKAFEEFADSGPSFPD